MAEFEEDEIEDEIFLAALEPLDSYMELRHSELPPSAASSRPTSSGVPVLNELPSHYETTTPPVTPPKVSQSVSTKVSSATSSRKPHTSTMRCRVPPTQTQCWCTYRTYLLYLPSKAADRTPEASLFPALVVLQPLQTLEPHSNQHGRGPARGALPSEVEHFDVTQEGQKGPDGPNTSSDFSARACTVM